MSTRAVPAARINKPVLISIKLIEEDPIYDGFPLDANPTSAKIVPKPSSEEKITSMALHHILQDTRPLNYHSHITNSPIQLLTNTSSQCLGKEVNQQYQREAQPVKPYKGFYNPFYEAKIANKSKHILNGSNSPERILQEMRNERSRIRINSSKGNVRDFYQPTQESVTSSFPGFETLSDKKLGTDSNQAILAVPQKQFGSRKIVSQRRHGNLESIIEISQSSRVNGDTDENIPSKDHLHSEIPSYEVFEPISPNLLRCIVKEDPVKMSDERKPLIQSKYPVKPLSNSHQKMSQALAGIKMQLGVFNENVKLRKSELNLEERQMEVERKKRENEAALYQLRQTARRRRGM